MIKVKLISKISTKLAKSN